MSGDSLAGQMHAAAAALLAGLDDRQRTLDDLLAEHYEQPADHERVT